MQVVCEATQNTNVAIQIAAFECLVRIMSLYYDKMAYYMERALFGVSQSSEFDWSGISNIISIYLTLLSFLYIAYSAWH